MADQGPTDKERADDFKRKFGSRVRYVPEWDKWLKWTGKRWEPDTQGLFVQTCGKQICASASGIAAMLKLVRDLVAIGVDELDAEPHILNTPNGMLDLFHDGMIDDEIYHPASYLLPHDPKRYCTKITNVGWRDRADDVQYDHETGEVWERTYLWDSFLEQMQPKEEIRQFLQRWCGYYLFGGIREHEMLCFVGEGANGKSTFVKVIQGVLGDYAGEGAHSLLIEQRNESHPTDLAAIKGLRFCVVAETPKNATINEARLSAITGGDRITARKMREDFWSFTPTAKLLMTSNHDPEITGTNEAIWRRVKRVPWTETVALEDRDHTLAARIIATEGQQVLDWMFAGWLSYLAETERTGHNGLTMPDCLIEDNLKFRLEQDVIGSFITDYGYETGAITEHSVSNSVFNSGLTDYCKSSGYERPNGRQTKKYMEMRGFIAGKAEHGSVRVWRGISLPSPLGARDGGHE